MVGTAASEYQLTGNVSLDDGFQAASSPNRLSMPDPNQTAERANSSSESSRPIEAQGKPASTVRGLNTAADRSKFGSRGRVFGWQYGPATLPAAPSRAMPKQFSGHVPAASR